MNNKLTITGYQKASAFIFFGNYFYGLCAVALSIEAMLQQRLPPNGFWYFFLVFIATVAYYTFPYVRKCSYVSSNPRTNWYTRNYELIKKTQLIFGIILVTSLLFFLATNIDTIVNLSILQWGMILIFPFAAALYYGNTFSTRKFNLRNTGWLKPFIIGFIWSGLVTLYPVLFYSMANKINYQLTVVALLLFIKNLMFISILCIMFDIKDYSTDYISRLKTFIVGIGLRKTIFYILLPLSTMGLGSFIFYAMTHQFNLAKILLNVLPFLLLIKVAWSLRKRRPLMYYLVIVDGLMLVKALCGSVAISFFP